MRVLFYLSFLILLTGIWSTLNAYVRLNDNNGHDLYWDLSESNNYIVSGNLQYHVITSGTFSVAAVTGSTQSEVITIIENSFKTWQNVSSGNVNFTRGSDITGTQAQAQDKFSVGFNSGTSTQWGGSMTGSTVGLAGTSFNTSNGKLLWTSICVLSTHSTNRTTNTADLQSTLVHEIGHSLGLDHSPQGSSVMSYVGLSDIPDAASGNAGHLLSSDDVVALTSIYPIDSNRGIMKGTIKKNGSSVHKAMVGVFDSNNNLVTTALSITGAFEIKGLLPGTYTLRLQPAMSSQSVNMNALYMYDTTSPTDFTSTTDVTGISITAGQTTTVSQIDVTNATSNIRPIYIIYSSGTTSSFSWASTTNALRLEPGKSHRIGLLGYNLPTSSSQLTELAYTGSGMTISNITYSGGSTSLSSLASGQLVSGTTSISFDLSVASSASPGSRSLSLKHSSYSNERFLFMGGLQIYSSNLIFGNPGFTMGNTSLTVTEGSTGTLDVKLNASPLSNVVIDVSSGNTSEATVSPSSLIFSTSNWNTTQTITVTGVEDSVLSTDSSTLTLSVNDASSDNAFDAIANQSVSLSLINNDSASFSVSPASVNMLENGGTATANVVLGIQPNSDVVFNVSSSSSTEATVSPSSLTFTTSNWNTPQGVTITGVNDNHTGDDQATISIAVNAASSDDHFDALSAQTVTANLSDDDSAGFSLSATTMSIAENGGTGSFNVVLNTQPGATVNFSISSANTTDVSISPSSLQFTTSNWSTSQNVTVTGLDDKIDRNDGATIKVEVSSSTDTNFSALSAKTVALSLTDDDTAGLTTNASSLTVSENSGTTALTVALNSQPQSDVTLAIASGNASEISLGTSTLTFTNSTWSTHQTVNLTGVNDNIDRNDSETITISVSSSTDSAYQTLSSLKVTVLCTDDDTAGIYTDLTAGATSESGSTSSFKVKLKTEPLNTVTLSASSSFSSEGTATPSSLSFSTSNWNTEQTLTATGIDDALIDGNRSYTVTLQASSSDGKYNSLGGLVLNLTNEDNELLSDVFTTTPASTTLLEDQAFTHTVGISNKTTGSNPTLSLVTPPTGMTLSSANVISWTPVQSQVGAHQITLRYTDDLIQSDQTITLNVQAVNDAPQLTASLNALTTPEDTPLITDLSGYKKDEEDPAGNLIWSVSEIDLSKTNATIQSDQLTITPAQNFAGNTTIKLTLTDSEGASVSSTESVTITAVNDPPVWQPLPPLFIKDGTSTSLDLSSYLSDVETATSALTVTVSSTNTQLGASIESGNTLKLTAASGYSGIDTLTLSATDGTSTTQTTVSATVSSNNPPVISTISALSMQEDDLTKTIDLSSHKSDVEDAPSLLSWSTLSSSDNLVSLSLSGDNLSITPLANASGNSFIHLILKDSQGADTSAAIPLSILPVNDAPAWSTLADITLLEDTVANRVLDLWKLASDVDHLDNQLIFNITQSSANLNPSIEDLRYLTLKPTKDYSGSDNIRLSVSDNLLSASSTLNVHITNVEDNPFIQTVPDLSTNEDTPATLDLSAYVSDPDEPLSSLTIDMSGFDTALVTLQLSGAKVTLTPKPDKFGTTKATLTVKDSQGNSTSSSFGINIISVNDPPVVNAGEDLILDIGVPVTLKGTATDVDGDRLTTIWKVTQNTSTGLELSKLSTLEPVVKASSAGTFILNLTASDNFTSVSDTVQIKINLPPEKVSAGSDQTRPVNNLVFLSATATDTNGDPLKYLWQVIQQPPGSSVLINNPNRRIASFIPTNTGQYDLEVTVSDGRLQSKDQMRVIVKNSSDIAPPTASEISTAINTLQGSLPENTSSLTEESSESLIITAATIASGDLNDTQRNTLFSAIESAVGSSQITTLTDTAISGTLETLKSLVPASNNTPKASEVTKSVDILSTLAEKGSLSETQINDGISVFDSIIRHQQTQVSQNTSLISGSEVRQMDQALRKFSQELAASLTGTDSGTSKTITSENIRITCVAASANTVTGIAEVKDSTVGLEMKVPRSALKQNSILMMTSSQLNPYSDLDSTTLVSELIHLEIYDADTQSNAIVNNLSEKIQLSFTYDSSLSSPESFKVQYFDETSGNWSSSGLTETGRNQSTIQVETIHLTPFSITKNQTSTSESLDQLKGGGGCLIDF